MTFGNYKRASYLQGSSVLHRCDARVKLALLLVYLLTTALLPIGAWIVYGLMGGILLVGVLASELPVAPLLKRSLILEIPILLVLLPQLFLQKGDYVALPPFAGFHLRLSLVGLQRVASLLVRSWLSLQFAVLITAATRFEDLLAGMRSCGLPRILADILDLMWRYLFILIEEVGRMAQARASRSSANANSPKQAGGSLVWRAQVTGGMTGTLLLRTLERSERIYQAMQARGYDGEARMTVVNGTMTFRQKMLILSFILTGAMLVWIAIGMGV